MHKCELVFIFTPSPVAIDAAPYVEGATDLNMFQGNK